MVPALYFLARQLFKSADGAGGGGVRGRVGVPDELLARCEDVHAVLLPDHAARGVPAVVVGKSAAGRVAGVDRQRIGGHRDAHDRIDRAGTGAADPPHAATAPLAADAVDAHRADDHRRGAGRVLSGFQQVDSAHGGDRPRRSGRGRGEPRHQLEQQRHRVGAQLHRRPQPHGSGHRGRHAQRVSAELLLAEQRPGGASLPRPANP